MRPAFARALPGDNFPAAFGECLIFFSHARNLPALKPDEELDTHLALFV
jgi:hypothetical protein